MENTRHWVEEIFEKSGAIVKGHFALTSGRHTGKYLDKALVYTDPENVSALCCTIAATTYVCKTRDIDFVIGPALGGVNLSQWTAYHLGKFLDRKITSLFTEKNESGKQAIKRNFKKLAAGKRALVIDDILTTGKSVKEVIEALRKAGGTVAAVAVICNRGKVTSEDIGGYPLSVLWETETESWLPEECPLCKAGVTLTDPKAL